MRIQLKNICILVCIFCITSFVSGCSSSRSTSSNNGRVTLTRSPLDPEAFESIVPMGIISPPDHIQPDNHMGFALNDSGPYNIYAPGDGTITMIFWTKRDWDPSSGKTGQYDDYDMEITCSSTFIVRFSHMAGIANSVLAKSGKLIFNQSTKVKIPVKAGDIVGTALKRLPQKCLDLWAMDSNVTVPFVRPDHHTASMNAVCPLDYFEDSVKTILLNKDPRTVEPRGGTATYDKAGTLAEVGTCWVQNMTRRIRSTLFASGMTLQIPKLSIWASGGVFQSERVYFVSPAMPPNRLLLQKIAVLLF